jgi:hypothetical protein
VSEDLSDDEALRELVAIAKEQLRWQQAATLQSVRDALSRMLTTTDMRRVYEMCDGDRTFRESATEAGVALGTVSGWTRRWREAALVFETDAGRMKQLVRLEAIGISIEVVGDAVTPRKKG